MNELTPDLIAQIATRLYNEIPAVDRIPKSETGTAEVVPAAARLPAGLPELPGVKSPVPTGGTAGDAGSVASSAAAPSMDGLSGFVQRIRAAGHATDGRYADVLQEEFQRRLLTGKSATVGWVRPFDVAAIRKDFPALHQRIHGKPLIWFDNAATTQKPQSVIDAVANFYSHDNSNIHRGAHALAARATDAFEQARQKVQAFLGASSAKEIVFVRGTTEGINLVAQTYGRKFLQPGDEIVLTTLEHHANIVPWQMVAKEKGP